MAASESTTILRARGMRAHPHTPESPEGATTVSETPAAKARRLTVGYFNQESGKSTPNVSTRQVPCVRLCGLWLRRAGFSIGQRIRVEVSDGRLTIVRAD